MVKSIKNGSKLLIGAGEIMQYLRCNKDLLKTFLEAGLPAAKISNRWYAHKDNIDEYFRRRTFQQNREVENSDIDG